MQFYVGRPFAPHIIYSVILCGNRNVIYFDTHSFLIRLTNSVKLLSSNGIVNLTVQLADKKQRCLFKY